MILTILAIFLFQRSSYGFPLPNGKAAQDVRRFGNTASSFFYPSNVRMAGINPTLQKRLMSKRQAMFNPVANPYYQTQYPNQYLPAYRNNFISPRSYISTPQNIAPAQQAPLQPSGFWSMLLFTPTFTQMRRNYVPAPPNVQVPAVKKDVVKPKADQATLESLDNFRKIVAEVKDAIVSMDANGKLDLKENFSGGDSIGVNTQPVAQKKSKLSKKTKGKTSTGKKRGSIKRKEQENKKNIIKEQIAKYFTDFVCGDYC